jgi:hypothetical protein
MGRPLRETLSVLREIHNSKQKTRMERSWQERKEKKGEKRSLLGEDQRQESQTSSAFHNHNTSLPLHLIQHVSIPHLPPPIRGCPAQMAGLRMLTQFPISINSDLTNGRSPWSPP